MRYEAQATAPGENGDTTSWRPSWEMGDAGALKGFLRNPEEMLTVSMISNMEGFWDSSVAQRQLSVLCWD